LKILGDCLGKAYIAATTRKAALNSYPVSETYGTYIAVGRPIAFVRVSGGQPAAVERGSRKLTAVASGPIYVSTCKGNKRDIQVLTQMSRFGVCDEPAEERLIRVLFSHINALIFAADRYLHAPRDGGDAVSRARLAELISETIRRLGKFDPDELEDAVDVQFAQGIRAFANAEAGRMESLLAKLEELRIEAMRPTTGKKMLDAGFNLVKWLTEISVRTAVEKSIRPDG
jgi:hypothetical protein